MGIRSKRAIRCQRCRMHQEHCLCPIIPRLELETRLVLVMHQRETVKTTATGPLALAALPNSELRIHGRVDAPLDFSDLADPGRRTLLLYPAEGAALLDREFLEKDQRPVTLVVPDGNWRQAARMGRRLPGLGHAELVRLPAGEPTEWGIRNEPHPEGLATFEAIARAMGIIESARVREEMEALFRRMVRRTLQTRGEWGAEERA